MIEMSNPPNMKSIDPSTSRRRVLLIGLDGATFDVILPLVEAGRLPVLRRLMETGAWGELLSTVPPFSPVAWSSFLTGKNPGRHGVFGFEEIEPGGYGFQPVGPQSTPHPSLWRLFSNHGRRVVALDIPFSYPPEPVNGCLIAGYGAPTGAASAFTYPPSLRADLAKRFGECEVAVPRMKAAPPREALFRRWDQILDNRRQIADYLMRTADWDVFMIVLGVTDHIQHGTWTYFEPLHPDACSPDAPRFREALFRYYEKADAFLGRLLDTAGEPIHVIVLSDHGFGTTWRGHLTRRVLSEAGWLRYRPFAHRRAMDLLHRAYDAMPWLKRFLHRRPADRARLKRAAAQAIDWRQTTAFPAALGRQVYINTRGVFPLGNVEPGAAYDTLCREIKERLEAQVAPGTDRRLVRRVWRRDETYRGEAAARAPDLLVEYENLHRATGDRNSKLRLPTDWDIVGSHTMNGIVIAWGPEIRVTRLEGARIVDVAPTVLHLAGLPVLENFDGCVLTDAFRREVLQMRPIRRMAGAEADAAASDERPLSPEEAASVREQLKNLGYID